MIEDFEFLKVEYSKLYVKRFESKIDKIKDLKDFEEKHRINIVHIDHINPQSPNYLEEVIKEDAYEELNPNSLVLMVTTADFEMATGITEKYDFKATASENQDDKLIVINIRFCINWGDRCGCGDG